MILSQETSLDWGTVHVIGLAVDWWRVAGKYSLSYSQAHSIGN